MLLAMKEAGLKPDEAGNKYLGDLLIHDIFYLYFLKQLHVADLCFRWFSTTCWVAASMTASWSWPRTLYSAGT